MFRKRRLERDRLQRVGAAVFAYMDDREAESWKWRQRAEKVGEETASDELGRSSVVKQVEDLLQLSGNDVGVLMQSLDDWWQARREQFLRTGDEHRADHVTGMQLSVGLNGIGNLFGFIPPEAPSFIEDLAAAGRERGWRK